MTTFFQTAGQYVRDADPFVKFIVIFTIIFFTVNHLRNPRILRNGKPLPRPSDTLPILGNGLRFLQDRHILFTWFTKQVQRFGLETYEISVPSLPPGCVINDPKNLEFVFKNLTDFSKGEFFKKRSHDLFGHGIINADGQLWKAQRKAGLQFLNAKNLNVLIDVELPKAIHMAIKDLEAKRSDDVVDLESTFLSITTKVMGKMAYDMEMSATDDFTRSFEYVNDRTTLRFQNPLWRVREFLMDFELRRSIKTVKTYGERIVKTAVEKREKGGFNITDEKLKGIQGSLILALLDTLKEHNLVADSALNYLTGGKDTVAQGLTWTFYLLLRHPHIMQKALDSINDPSIVETLSADPSMEGYASISPTQVPYIFAIFYEALRLYPPVPFELKQAMTDVTLPDGTFLPKSSIVLWCTYAMNHSPALWGPDAEEFKPERWLDESKLNLIQKSTSEFPVFNGGPRTCLGKGMAERTGVAIMTNVLFRFKFDAAWDIEDGLPGRRTSRNSLTMPMQGGLPVHVRPRRNVNGTLAA